jgi:hypothetical protein
LNFEFRFLAKFREVKKHGTPPHPSARDSLSLSLVAAIVFFHIGPRALSIQLLLLLLLLLTFPSLGLLSVGVM